MGGAPQFVICGGSPRACVSGRGCASPCLATRRCLLRPRGHGHMAIRRSRLPLLSWPLLFLIPSVSASPRRSLVHLLLGGAIAALAELAPRPRPSMPESGHTRSHCPAGLGLCQALPALGHPPCRLRGGTRRLVAPLLARKPSFATPIGPDSRPPAHSGTGPIRQPTRSAPAGPPGAQSPPPSPTKGLGLGVSAIAAPLYIAEISPRERRGRLCPSRDQGPVLYLEAIG